MFGKLKFKKNCQPRFSRGRKLETKNSGPTASIWFDWKFKPCLEILERLTQGSIKEIDNRRLILVELKKMVLMPGNV